MIDNRRKRLFVALAIFIGAVLSIGVVWSLSSGNNDQSAWPDKSQPITFTVSSGVTAKLYDANTPEDHQEVGDIPPEDKLISTLTGTEKVTLKPGRYAITTPQTNSHQASWQGINVLNSPITVTVAPQNTTGVLGTQLEREREAIAAAIRRDVPSAEQLYNIQTGKLLAQGEWFGTVLSYKGNRDENNNSDTLRLVARKENGQWKVITKPPVIIVSIKTFPQIPLDVATAVNGL